MRKLNLNGVHATLDDLTDDSFKELNVKIKYHDDLINAAVTLANASIESVIEKRKVFAELYEKYTYDIFLIRRQK